MNVWGDTPWAEGGRRAGGGRRQGRNGEAGPWGRVGRRQDDVT